MTSPESIAKYKKSYENSTDDELLNILHLKVPHAPEHIAAQQVINSRDREFTAKQYETDKSTNILTKWILGLTIILLIFAATQLAYSFGAFSTDSVVLVDTPSAIENAEDTTDVNNAK